MIINSISSKDSNEIRTMCTKSNNIEFPMGNETDEVIEESLLQKYQEGLEEKMRGNEFVFDSIRLFYYNLHEINLNRSESYIDSLKWLKNKKATINQKNNDDNWFQCALTVALNYEQIKKDSQKISKIKPFIKQYDW